MLILNLFSETKESKIEIFLRIGESEIRVLK